MVLDLSLGLHVDDRQRRRRAREMPEMVKAGMVNVHSHQEVIFTIYRHNKTSLLVKKRTLKKKPVVEGSCVKLF